MVFIVCEYIYRPDSAMDTEIIGAFSDPYKASETAKLLTEHMRQELEKDDESSYTIDERLYTTPNQKYTYISRYSLRFMRSDWRSYGSDFVVSAVPFDQKGGFRSYVVPNESKNSKS